MVQPVLFLAITALLVQLRSPATAPPSPWTPASAQQSSSPAVVASSLDYETFRTKVQPILTSPRKGQRAVHGVPLARRRQRVSRAAVARQHDVHRRAVAA